MVVPACPTWYPVDKYIVVSCAGDAYALSTLGGPTTAPAPEKLKPGPGMSVPAPTGAGGAFCWIGPPVSKVITVLAMKFGAYGSFGAPTNEPGGAVSAATEPATLLVIITSA